MENLNTTREIVSRVFQRRCYLITIIMLQRWWKQGHWRQLITSGFINIMSNKVAWRYVILFILSGPVIEVRKIVGIHSRKISWYVECCNSSFSELKALQPLAELHQLFKTIFRLNDVAIISNIARIENCNSNLTLLVKKNGAQ